MIELFCFKCKEELKELGALLFSPPLDFGAVNKFHICIKCYNIILNEHKNTPLDIDINCCDSETEIEDVVQCTLSKNHKGEHESCYSW